MQLDGVEGMHESVEREVDMMPHATTTHVLNTHRSITLSSQAHLQAYTPIHGSQEGS